MALEIVRNLRQVIPSNVRSQVKFAQILVSEHQQFCCLKSLTPELRALCRINILEVVQQPEVSLVLGSHPDF